MMIVSLQHLAVLLLAFVSPPVAYGRIDFHQSAKAVESGPEDSLHSSSRSLLSANPSIRINCGGDAFTDSEGNVWSADEYFLSGATVSKESVNVGDIQNTTDDGLFLSQRNFWATGDAYKIPIPRAGPVQVNLFFAELYWNTPKKRVFDIFLQRELVFPDYDPVFEASGKFAASSISITTDTIDTEDNGVSYVLITFVRKVDRPQVNGIEIIPLESYTDSPSRTPDMASTPYGISSTFDPIRINCGGGAFLDVMGREWMTDAFYERGQPQTSQLKEIAGTDDDGLYCSARYSENTDIGFPLYEIEVPVADRYDVNLHFAETHFESKDKRTFSVLLEDEVVLASLDLVRDAGANTAFIFRTSVYVDDGDLSIAFIKELNNPIISAIEVLPQGYQDDESFELRYASAAPTFTDIPNNAPSGWQSLSPTASEISPTSASPSLVPAETPFEAIRINCGGDEYTDNQGYFWMKDSHYKRGMTYASFSKDIDDARDDYVFHTY